MIDWFQVEGEPICTPGSRYPSQDTPALVQRAAHRPHGKPCLRMGLSLCVDSSHESLDTLHPVLVECFYPIMTGQSWRLQSQKPHVGSHAGTGTFPNVGLFYALKRASRYPNPPRPLEGQQSGAQARYGRRTPPPGGRGVLSVSRSRGGVEQFGAGQTLRRSRSCLLPCVAA